MDVLFDTNIVLDVILDREPHAVAARELWARAAAGKITGYLVATTLTNVFYLTRKAIGAEAARRAIADLLTLFRVCPVDHSTLSMALDRPMRDFEDAVQDAAAERSNVSVIVTRNQGDFAASKCRILDTIGLLRELDGIGMP